MIMNLSRFAPHSLPHPTFQADELIEADMSDSERLIDLYEKLDAMDASRGESRTISAGHTPSPLNPLQPKPAPLPFSTAWASPPPCRRRRPRCG